MSRRAVNAPPFPCLQAPEIRRAYDLCEAALDDDSSVYRSVAEAELPELAPVDDEDTPEWWQLYEVEIWNNKPVRAWLKPLLKPADPRTAFATAARGVYALARLTEAEASACLLHHEGESYRRVARALDRDVKTVFQHIKDGEAKLAALKEL